MGGIDNTIQCTQSFMERKILTEYKAEENVINTVKEIKPMVKEVSSSYTNGLTKRRISPHWDCLNL